MKRREKFEIEITRNNVTPAEFLSYVRRMVDKKGGRMIRSDLDIKYFAAGDDLNFDITHEDGMKEKSVSKPYQMQTYIKSATGEVYNEICEFDFWDEKKGTGYYYLLDVSIREEEDEMKTTEAVKKEIEGAKAGSAWLKGVKVYALELLEGLEEAITGGWFDVEDLAAPKLVDRALLNGAQDWNEYSWGGCSRSLIYNEEIARRLCSPSELRKTENGQKRPNSREEWLDTQARALFQAAGMVKAAINAAVVA